MKYEEVIAEQMKERQRLATGGDRKSERYKKQGMSKRSDLEKLNPITKRKELAKIAGMGEE